MDIETNFTQDEITTLRALCANNAFIELADKLYEIFNSVLFLEEIASEKIRPSDIQKDLDKLKDRLNNLSLDSYGWITSNFLNDTKCDVLVIDELIKILSKPYERKRASLARRLLTLMTNKLFKTLGIPLVHSTDGEVIAFLELIVEKSGYRANEYQVMRETVEIDSIEIDNIEDEFWKDRLIQFCADCDKYKANNT